MNETLRLFIALGCLILAVLFAFSTIFEFIIKAIVTFLLLAIGIYFLVKKHELEDKVDYETQ